ncbi:hypothetical protein BKH30_07065 [Actinomyces oris]|uniref:Transposase n=1 Tax=Actinomyces oris TaxID=544580 RepID=A0A1Q8VFN6_9ACTO|nr:hypothetical protein BKH31_06135 [Actinomyces oris]OLO52286.1 hypothetical protein BKH30_07065 [Actinomyces oris]
MRRQAVDLYETTPGATVRGIAQDLGIERGTLRQWLTWYGTGRKTGADGRPAPSPLRPQPSDGSPTSRRTQETTPEVIARLEADNAELRAQRSQAWPGSERSFSRRPSISPERRSGEPFPVR